jgi:hypothetical protein
MKRTLHLLPFLAFTFTAAAQIPNGGFETWSNASGTNEPANWGTLNPLGTLLGVEFATQGVGAVGAYCIELTTQEVPGIGILPSIAFVGDAETETEGFPYTSRPAALTGQLKFMPQGEDMASVVVNLWRWDAGVGERVDIGTGYYLVSTGTPDWTEFSVPIEYATTETPDSASVTLLSSVGESTTAGSMLSIDALAFNSSTDIADDEALRIALHPNPAHEQVWIEANEGVLNSIEVWGADGRLVHTRNATDTRVAVDIRTLPVGTYHVRALTAGGAALRTSFVKY